MTRAFSIALFLAALLILAWGVRWLGRRIFAQAPFFRDMSYGVALGYVAAGVALLWLAWAYGMSRLGGAAELQRYFFLRLMVEGFALFACLAWVFRLLGRQVGTAASRRWFRTMPLTASFGVLTILVYAFVAIFAAALAPYGQEQVLEGVAANIPPGGDISLGGNPDFPLGTDQIGRDIP